MICRALADSWWVWGAEVPAKLGGGPAFISAHGQCFADRVACGGWPHEQVGDLRLAGGFGDLYL